MDNISEEKTKFIAVRNDTLIVLMFLTVFFSMGVLWYILDDNKDIRQDINILNIKINNKTDKDKYMDHLNEFAVNEEKTNFNEQVIIKGLDMDSETFHKYFIERKNNGKR